MVLKPDTQTKPRMHITWVHTDTLKPYESNAKIHSPRQIKMIAASIQENGFTNPIIIDKKPRAADIIQNTESHYLSEIQMHS